MEECMHELKILSEPVVDIDVSLLGGGGYFCPPIFQCMRCHKVFKTGYNEYELIEMPVKTIEDLKKEESEYKHEKRKIKLPIWLILALVIGTTTIILMLTYLLR